MTTGTTVAPLQFWSEEPSKYDYAERDTYPVARHEAQRASGVEKINYPEIQFDTASEYVAEILDSLLPILIKQKRPKTVEFINYDTQGTLGRLRGVIIRNADQEVLLYVYGVGLTGSPFGVEVRECVFRHFGITSHEQQQLINTAWPKIDYSVMFEVR